MSFASGAQSWQMQEYFNPTQFAHADQMQAGYEAFTRFAVTGE